MVRILYSHIDKKMSLSHFRQYLSRLPVELRRKNDRFVYWDDKLRHLIGKMLLIGALEDSGFGQDQLGKLSYNEYGRPSLPGCIDFNISHSGNYVLCAYGHQVDLGVDIELIQYCKFEEFDIIMSADQWNIIKNADDPIRSFYSFWVKKESIIKADSRGLSLPVADILIDRDTAWCEGKPWHLTELHIDKQYCACLASSIRHAVSIEYKQLQY